MRVAGSANSDVFTTARGFRRATSISATLTGLGGAAPHWHSAVRLIPIDRDKIGRLYVQQAKFEAGLVLFPKDAGFLTQLEPELLTFPQAKTDDIVDSVSQALAYKPGYDTTLSWVG